MRDLPIKIKLPARFLEKEYRCGYEVSATLKQVWAVELDLLSQLLQVCRKNGIEVQVFAGTLLGAVRHKGMIPWDDDIDVAMSRDDFEKLCSVAPHEFSSPYFFQTALTDRKRFSAYARLRNSLTTGAISGMDVPGFNNGIFIDVFPLDGLPDQRWKHAVQLCLMKVVRRCCISYYNFGNVQTFLQKVVVGILWPFVRILPYAWWIKLHTKIMSMWNDSCNRIALRGSFAFGERYWMMKSDLTDLIDSPFESLKVPVPRHYDLVLRRIYGDYMEFPPASERGKWHGGKIRFDPLSPYTEVIK